MSKTSQPPLLEKNAASADDFEFTLNQNINALIILKNENIAQYTQDVTDITSALVDLKWKNRREIYPLRFKEEVYGAVLSEIIHSQPKLKQIIISRLEENYQQIKTREAQTLSITRGLIEGTYKTPNL
ncbi:cytoplasmic protein [Enterobacter sp. R1(2018)]|uniref:cytoplasmic protein n=1 Tax=Enterobacter sp. R1(2018) TaxID=2447891 RepID=UPI000EB1A71B|nr:cytoplasmic protein [Enterobacter sp. R1(2018)]RKQ39185.1 cytoplasmic protein [Enterobacter sp. R1(2018)]